MCAGWAAPLELLREELKQRRDEGCDLPGDLERAISSLDPEADAWRDELIDPLYDRLARLVPDRELMLAEPARLDEIKAQRPAGPRDLRWTPSSAELADRIHGALACRAAGCALGKPVETMSLSGGTGEGRRRIRDHLQRKGDWPLGDYFDHDRALESPLSQRDAIAFCEPDDDINYTLASLCILEQFGAGYTWRDVAFWWSANIPIACICTAELQALLNLLNQSVRGREGAATPEFTRRHRNPYREWIGAQIRADGWAYAAPGKPELAAELAWRDAHWTHERNGIYGEMFFAALISAAFVEPGQRQLVDIGLSEIPADCRLARAIRKLLLQLDAGDDFERCLEWIERDFAGASPVHVIPNALACLIALFQAGMDELKAPALAVMCGLDTDCNGATVGSVVGAVRGRHNLRGDLVDRQHDVIRTPLAGTRELRMTELAERWTAIAER